MEEYKYELQTFDLKNSVKIRTWWQGVTGRKYMLKHFCFTTGIELPLDTQKHYKLPNKFIVEEAHIKYLGVVRDNILLSQFDKLKAKQNVILKKASELTATIKNDDEYLDVERSKLAELKELSSKAKDPLEKISLQHKHATQEAKVKNLSEDLDEIKIELESILKTFKDNRMTWKKQVDLTNGIIQGEIDKFIVSITKKIRNQLNYTEFDYIVPKYSESVENILSGDIDEK